MKKGINLINKEAQKTRQFIKLKNSIRKGIFILLVFLITLDFLIFFGYWAVSQIYRRSQTKAANLREQIKAHEKTESYVVTIANRLRGINTILQKRKSYEEVMGEIENFSVSGFSLENLEIGSAGELKISGICQDQLALAEFNDLVEKIKEQNKYREIIYPSVSRSTKGYLVSLELKL